MEARKLLRDWFQIISKMNCMLAVPVLLETKIGDLLFPDVFVASGKWFRRSAQRASLLTKLNIRAHASALAELIGLLEAILLLLSITSCALVLIAFWGCNLLGNEWRRRH